MRIEYTPPEKRVGNPKRVIEMTVMDPAVYGQVRMKMEVETSDGNPAGKIQLEIGSIELQQILAAVDKAAGFPTYPLYKETIELRNDW